MIELSNCRQIILARRSSGAGCSAGLRAATAVAVLGAASLLPLVTRPAVAAPPVRQTAAPPARAGQAAPGGAAFAGTPQGAAASAPASAPAAAPVSGPAPAHASAPADVSPATAPAVTSPLWNDLAMCESSGNWHINSGNGFYGGLQFWQPTWQRFGGRKYARRADLATRDHQITIAREVLRAQGWQAWPACSRRLDLPARSAAASADPVGPAGSSDAAKGQAANGSGAGTKHTVARGETLSGIAATYHVSGGWKRLYEMNKSVIGPNPNRVVAGAVLTLP